MINEVGLLPYSQRLEQLKLTTLAERRIRGDLIETFKITNSLVSYGQSLFNTGRSGNSLISRPSKSFDKNIKKMVNDFLPQRVIKYWNKLPIGIRCCETVNTFKTYLEQYKSTCPIKIIIIIIQ